MIYQGKTVLVTASSTGIGFAIARAFGKLGANVVITSRKVEQVNAAVDALKQLGVQAKGFPCDNAKSSDLDRLIDFTVQAFKSIDILVPNLAVSTHFGSLMDISENAMKKMVNSNIIASLLLIQKSQPFMPVGSNIIIISSVEGYTLNPIPIGFYGVTKTALIALTKSLSKELTDIRVNCIAPGLIKTKFSQILWEGKEDAVKESLEVDRLGEVDDIAHTAIYLSQATYVRGETIVVAGKTAPKL